MKIVQAAGWYFPESLGGTEVYVAGLSRRLVAAGHDVMVAAPDPGHPDQRCYEHEGIPVFRYPIPPRPTREECQGVQLVRGVERFHAWLDKQQPDVVHFHTFVTGLGLAELRAARTTGARVIATTHLGSLGWLCQRGSMIRWGRSLCDGVAVPAKCAACDLQLRGLPRPIASAVGAVPPRLGALARRLPGRLGTALSMSELIVRNLAQQREMLEIVDRFVVLNRWAQAVVVANGAPPDKVIMNQLGLSAGGITPKPGPETRATTLPVRVGCVGRFDPNKGMHDLARAVMHVPRDLAIRVEFRGPAQGEYLRKLRDLVGNDPRVEFAPPVAPSAIPDVLARYDVLCCPSVVLEGGPTVAIEAQAVGTPVIGTRVGGLADLITDGVNGRLVPIADWRALARVLREVVENPAGTIDRWRRALPTPRTMDQVAADYLALYVELSATAA